MSGLGRAACAVFLAIGAAAVVGACDREDLTVATVGTTSLTPDAGDGGGGGDDDDDGSGIPTCFNDDDCPTDAYCNKPGCGPRGHCQFPSPCSEADSDASSGFLERDPQCGCNGVTYWNQCLLQGGFQSLRYTGECQDDEHAASCGMSDDCTRITGKQHPSYCARFVAGDHACDGDDLTGTCWAVPYDCVGVTNDPAFFLPCNSSDFQCVSQCSAIFSGTVVTFAEDSCR